MKIDADALLAGVVVMYVMCIALLVLLIFYTLPIELPIVQKIEVLDKRPRMCDNLYNVGQSEAWRQCMGVERK